MSVLKDRKNSRGFTMIELLVSVVIMSVGVLGMAGLQMLSMQQNRSALLQGEATQLVNDILDRMRANPDTSYDGVDIGDDPVVTDSCIGNTCTENEMKDFDVAQWLCAINSVDESDGSTHTVCDTFGITGSLPLGSGSVVLTGDIYEVTVQWSDSQKVSDSAGTTRSVVINAMAP
jgi:type IV pilus assembly protein PilV